MAALLANSGTDKSSSGLGSSFSCRSLGGDRGTGGRDFLASQLNDFAAREEAFVMEDNTEVRRDRLEDLEGLR